jgi:WD40 repeat protein
VAAAEGQIVLVDTADASVDTLMPLEDVEAMAISDDGAAVAVGRADGTIEIFDRGTRTVTAQVLANPPREVDEVVLPTGATLDADSDADLRGIDTLVFDSTGDRIVSSGGVYLRSWNAADLTPAGPEIIHLWGEDEFNLVATPPQTVWVDEDGDTAVTAGGSFVAAWSISTGERLSLDTVSSDTVDAAAAGPLTALLLSDDGRIIEHTVETSTGSGRRGADIVFDTGERTVSRLTVDDAGTRLAVATDDGVVVASLDGTRLIARAVPIGSSDRPTISSDGRTLAAGVVSDGLYDLTVDPPRRRTFDVGVEVAQTAGSPATYEFIKAGQSDFLMWTSAFMQMRNAYDFGTGEYVGVFWGPYVPAWSDDGRRLFRRLKDGATRVDEPAGDLRAYTGPRPMESADFDSTGERLVLVGGEDTSPVLVDLETREGRPLPGTVVAAAFTPDDQRILTVSSLGAVTLLDAQTLEPTRRLEDAGLVSGRPIRPPVLDEDGQLMFSASDGEARIWHLDSGRQIGKPLPTLAGGRPHGVADGDTLRVVTPLDGTALVWNLEMDEWVDLACEAAGRNMTEAEWASYGPRDTEPRATCSGL